MFSNKGNINKDSSGNNHIAGNNNIIKNESNNTNNYYGISWKFITLFLPSPKHTNKRNVVLGWSYLVLIILTHIARNFLPIESNPHPSNPPSTSQTPTAVLSASTTPASPSISATYSTSSLPSVQTTSPYPSGSQSVSSPAITPSATPSTRSGYIEFELSTRYIDGGKYLGKDNDYPDSDVAEYSKTGDKIKIGYIWKVKDSSGTSKYGENCSIDFNLYEKDNPQSIDHIKNPQCDSSSVFNISKKGHYIIKAVDSKSSVEGTVEFTIR